MDIIPHPGFKCYTGIFHLHSIETVQEVFKRPALDQKTVPILKGNPCRRIVFCQASNLFLSKSKVLRRLFYCQGVSRLNRNTLPIVIDV